MANTVARCVKLALTKTRAKCYTNVELFAGAGGCTLGLANASYRGSTIQNILAIDINKDACATNRANLGSNVLCTDVRSFDFTSIRDNADVDIMTMGFPCNDYSAVGAQEGMTGKYGSLMFVCGAAVKAVQPLCFIAENVEGLRHANDGSAFKACIDMFQECGYNVYQKLINCSDYGIAQNRKRQIFVGFRKDLDVHFEFPAPLSSAPVTAKMALTVPEIPADCPNNEPRRITSRVVERLSYIPEGGNAFSPSVPEHLRLHSSLKLSNCYRRLFADKPAPTVVASNGGGNVLYHWSENRALTNRELARLQSFPDWFVFHGNRASVKTQIGMAVPPLLAKLIAEQVLKALYSLED